MGGKQLNIGSNLVISLKIVSIQKYNKSCENDCNSSDQWKFNFFQIFDCWFFNDLVLLLIFQSIKELEKTRG